MNSPIPCKGLHTGDALADLTIERPNAGPGTGVPMAAGATKAAWLQVWPKGYSVTDLRL